MVTVSGDGTYTRHRDQPRRLPADGTGSYLWSAVYSGDSNNNGATDNGQNESETVSPASPAINTVAGGTVIIGSGTKLTDTAVLIGRLQPDRHHHLHPVQREQHGGLHRRRSRSAATAPTPRPPAPTPAATCPRPPAATSGTAVYSGDSNNNGAQDNGQNENEAVTPASPAINTIAGATSRHSGTRHVTLDGLGGALRRLLTRPAPSPSP